MTVRLGPRDIVSVVRVVAAARELAAPQAYARLRDASGGPSTLALLSAGRGIAQGILLLGAGRAARRLGAGVDVLHAASMLVLAAGRRRGALAEAVMAAVFACAEWSTSTPGRG